MLAARWSGRDTPHRMSVHRATTDARGVPRGAVPGVGDTAREPGRWCRRATEPTDPIAIPRELASPVGAGDHHRLVCAACRALLADDARATERAGAHRHLCANPAGVVYPIRLFVGSWSVAAVGTSSAAHSWFPGSTWQIAVCRRCHLHLGWLFHEAAPFAGLIEGAFVEESGPGADPGGAA